MKTASIYGAGNVSPAATLQIVSVTPFTFCGGVNRQCWRQNSGRATVLVSVDKDPYTCLWKDLPT